VYFEYNLVHTSVPETSYLTNVSAIVFSSVCVFLLSGRQVPVDRFFALRDAVQALVPAPDVGSVSDAAEDVTSQCVRAP
jgi:hypothetical protein